VFVKFFNVISPFEEKIESAKAIRYGSERIDRICPNKGTTVRIEIPLEQKINEANKNKTAK
jgi:hypothetical protein